MTRDHVVLPLNSKRYPDAAVLLDTDDYAWVGKWKWSAWWSGKISPNGSRVLYAGRKDESGRTIYLHRLLAGATARSVQVDHINHDTLDNRRENLRIVTNQMNQWNRRKTRSETSSRFKGVCWAAREMLWRSSIHVQGRHCHIGFFSSEQEAAEAYDQAAITAFGDLACLNFPARKGIAA